MQLHPAVACWRVTHACAFLAQKALAPESLPWPARVRVRFAVLSARVRIRALLRETFGRAASTGQKADCLASFSKRCAPLLSASPRPRGAAHRERGWHTATTPVATHD